jgi:predicted enzyme related to lactoylglutathione lyase
MKNKNVTAWFEIPVTDMARAAKFYEVTLGAKMKVEDYNGRPMAIFPKEHDEGATGCLVADPQHKPSAQGSLVYLDAREDLVGALTRARKAGGKVLLDKTEIGEHGAIAILEDTEGNRVGLHSPR